MRFGVAKVLITFLAWSFAGYAQTFDELEEFIHIVRLKTTKESSDYGRGTAFVVNKDGLLATNYHVISHIFKEGKRNEDVKIYVKVKEKEFLAEVYRFDIASDLALLKIPHVFADQMKLRSSRLPKGSKIFSLGFHDKEFMAINQGTLNDYLKITANEMLAITCPVNPGMSGGPIVDASFEVVGINDMGTNKQADAYGVNVQRLMWLMEEAEPKQTPTLEENLRRQLQASYRKLLAAIDISHERKPMNDWKLLSFDHFMECHESKEEYNPNQDFDDPDKNRILVSTRECSLDPRKVPLFLLDAEVFFHYSVASIQKSPNTRAWTYYGYLNDKFKFQTITSSILGEQKYRCRREVIENDSGVKFKTSICLFKPASVPGFIKEKDHYRYEVKATTMSPTMDNLLVHAQFTGSRDLAKGLIKKLINGVRK